MKKALVLILFFSGLLFSQTDKGIISGRVRSLDGSPALGVRVAAVPIGESSTAAPVTTAEISSLGQTDASGNFRLENLQPGRYRVFAGLVELPTYYPGVAEVGGATVVSIAAGATVTGIDFSMVRPGSLKVSGRVTLPAPTAPGPTFGRVTLMPRSPALVRIQPMDGQVRADGTFEIVNVLPGTYAVIAAALNTTLKEPVSITVESKDVTGIELVLLSTDTPTTLKGLEQAWSVPGTWGGAVSNEKEGLVFATTRSTRFEIDSTGKTLREKPFPASAKLRPAKFAAGPAFLSFGTWSPAVSVFDDTGMLLWSYPSATQGPSAGIDDASAVDLDGDGSDEIVIGFNGGTGVHVVNSKGEVVWKSTAIGNVWHVAGGDVRGNGKPQVITTSAIGQVHVFSDDGSDRRNISPGFYTNVVRVGKLSETDTTATIFAGGASSIDGSSWRVAALSGAGTLKWSADLVATGRPAAYSTVLATSKPWMAVGLQSGQVFVVDATNGTVLATADGQGSNAELTWVAEKDTGVPLLVVSSRTGLRAYRIKLP